MGENEQEEQQKQILNAKETYLLCILIKYVKTDGVKKKKLLAEMGRSGYALAKQ